MSQIFVFKRPMPACEDLHEMVQRELYVIGFFAELADIQLDIIEAPFYLGGGTCTGVTIDYYVKFNR